MSPPRRSRRRRRSGAFSGVGLERTLIVGIHWIAQDGSRRDPFVFQLVTVDDGRVAHFQDYKRKEHALKAAALT